MIKISLFLKKLDINQENSEYITIANPQKILEGKLTGLYSCEVYLPETERKLHTIYADNPIEAFCNASEFVKVYLQGLISRGYTISEAESHEPWKLEKKDPQVYLQEKMDELKNNKNISFEDREKILGIMKDSFGKIPHMKGYFE